MIVMVGIPTDVPCTGDGPAPRRRDVQREARATTLKLCHRRRRVAQPRLQIIVAARNQAKHLAVTQYYWLDRANRGKAIRGAEV
jgi:hypothetical protein